MRRAVFALLVLCSAAATAQVTISDEVLSDPLTRRLAPLNFGAPAVALAQDRTGVAVVWSMANASGADRIYVARLDAAGHATGDVRVMPITLKSFFVHATYPSIAAAPGGDGFLLGWQEMDPSIPTRALSLFAKLDAALTPATPTSLSVVPILTAAPVLVRSQGDVAWVTVNNSVWSIQRDGTLGAGPLTTTLASDMVIAMGYPDTVGNRSAPTAGSTCPPGCAPLCNSSCRIFGVSSSLIFTALFSTSQSKSFTNGNDSQPAIGSNGSDDLLVWMNGAPSSGGDVMAARVPVNNLTAFGTAVDHARSIGTFPPGLPTTRPSIATDGQRYVVVWTVQKPAGEHDVVGVSIETDGRLVPLSIATSVNDERDPDILYVGGGSFLVGYEKTINFERHIAGRFVTFGRQHAVR